jgi:hypothetical protein
MPEITLEKELALNLGDGLLGLLKLVTLNDGWLSDLNSINVAVHTAHGGAQHSTPKP